MCAIDPMFAFEVKEERVNRALELIKTSREKLSKDQAFQVFFELGFGDALDYEAQGKLTLHLTDLQFVAAAAAMAAVMESGGRMTEREQTRTSPALA